MPLATFGDYEVAGCVVDCGYVDAGAPMEDAHFFGVYVRLPPDPDYDNHRFASHIADFDDLDDAIEYAQFKHNQEPACTHAKPETSGSST